MAGRVATATVIDRRYTVLGAAFSVKRRQTSQAARTIPTRKARRVT